MITSNAGLMITYVGHKRRGSLKICMELVEAAQTLMRSDWCIADSIEAAATILAVSVILVQVSIYNDTHV